MKVNRVIILSILFSLLNTGCMYAIRYDGTYSGKVIDVDTEEPIEAVVVLGVWNKEYTGAPGTISEFYDARETVTDKKGEFKITGQGLRIMTNLAPMNILIFKAGYTYFGTYTWNEFRRTVRFEDNKPVVRLRKLTMEERRKQGTPNFYIGVRYDEKEKITHSCLPKNIKLLPNEINKELLEQGRKPYDLEGGRCEK